MKDLVEATISGFDVGSKAASPAIVFDALGLGLLRLAQACSGLLMHCSGSAQSYSA